MAAQQQASEQARTEAVAKKGFQEGNTEEKNAVYNFIMNNWHWNEAEGEKEISDRYIG